MVIFSTPKAKLCPAPRRQAYEETVALAIEVSRPEDERWLVTICEPLDGAIVRFDFVRGTEMAHSLSFALDNDDLEHTALYRIVYQFLRSAWPGGIHPS